MYGSLLLKIQNLLEKYSTTRERVLKYRPGVQRSITWCSTFFVAFSPFPTGFPFRYWVVPLNLAQPPLPNWYGHQEDIVLLDVKFNSIQVLCMFDADNNYLSPPAIVPEPFRYWIKHLLRVVVGRWMSAYILLLLLPPFFFPFISPIFNPGTIWSRGFGFLGLRSRTD